LRTTALEHYEGIFLKNKYQGQGKLFWKNGDNYEGSFANDALNGFGIYTFSKNNVYGNNKYSGYFKDNKRNGNGTMISNDGHKYAGMFQNNLRDGYGILYFPTQDLRHMYQGYHERGYLEGEGRLIWKNGNILVGHFSEDLPNGFGVVYSAQGLVIFKGLWNNGRPAFR
jgi:hypothetical protein